MFGMLVPTDRGCAEWERGKGLFWWSLPSGGALDGLKKIRLRLTGSPLQNRRPTTPSLVQCMHTHCSVAKCSLLFLSYSISIGVCSTHLLGVYRFPAVPVPNPLSLSLPGLCICVSFSLSCPLVLSVALSLLPRLQRTDADVGCSL